MAQLDLQDITRRLPEDISRIKILVRGNKKSVNFFKHIFNASDFVLDIFMAETIAINI